MVYALDWEKMRAGTIPFPKRMTKEMESSYFNYMQANNLLQKITDQGKVYRIRKIPKLPNSY